VLGDAQKSELLCQMFKVDPGLPRALGALELVGDDAQEGREAR
jgi:hypothetical protein